MDEEKLKSLRTVTIAVYALQAAGFVTGGLGFLVAIVMNYVKKDEVAGTPDESHYDGKPMPGGPAAGAAAA